MDFIPFHLINLKLLGGCSICYFYLKVVKIMKHSICKGEVLLFLLLVAMVLVNNSLLICEGGHRYRTFYFLFRGRKVGTMSWREQKFWGKTKHFLQPVRSRFNSEINASCVLSL